MDASTPNPKPRPSRRLLSQFTLTLSVLLALSFVIMAVVGPITKEVKADDDPYNPVDDIGDVFPFNAWTDILSAYLLGLIDDDQAEASGNAVSAYRQIIAQSYNNTLELARCTALNGAELAQLTTNFYARAGEMAALALYQKQIQNGQELTYDRNAMLELGRIDELLHDQCTMATQHFKKVLKTFNGLQNRFLGDYADMYLLFDGASTQGTLADPLTFVPGDFITMGTSGYYVLPMNQYVYCVGSGTTYLTNNVKFSYPNGTLINQFNYSYDYNRNIAKIYLPDIIEANMGSNFDIKSDIMLKIETTGAGKQFLVFESATPIVSDLNSVSLPGVIAHNSALKLTGEGAGGGFVYWYTDGTTKCNLFDSTALVTDTVDFNIIVSGGGLTYINILDDIMSVKTAYDEIKTMATVANNYAQTYYNYLVVNGDDGIPYTPPTVLLIDPVQMANMTASELYAIYLAYMSALMAGFENGYTVTLGNVTIAIDSLKLVCRGTIYNETGGIVADNQTIFTPFPTIADIQLNIGNNTMNQAGFAIKWGENASIGSLMTDPSNTVFTPEMMRYISYGVNWTFDIEEMYYMGEPIESILLEVTDLTVYSPNLQTPPPGPEVLNDMEWLMSRWYYFAMVAGVLCLIAAISFRNTAIIIIGLVLLAAGGIGYYLAGDFSLLDWLSMEPPNLTAWLQHLR